MTEDAIAALVDAGDLEAVEADTDAAMIDVEDAKTHLLSAKKLLEDDPVMAYTAAYDAVRKAVAGHMRANGFRVRGKVGHHTKTMKYAVAALDAAALGEDLERLDEMRVVRNDAEYGRRRVGRADVEADLETARRVVAAIERAL